MENIESFRDDIAGSNPTVDILFFRNLGNFKIAKKGWSSKLQQNLTSPIFFYAPENPMSPKIILSHAIARKEKVW